MEKTDEAGAQKGDTTEVIAEAWSRSTAKLTLFQLTAKQQMLQARGVRGKRSVTEMVAAEAEIVKAAAAVHPHLAAVKQESQKYWRRSMRKKCMNG